MSRCNAVRGLAIFTVEKVAHGLATSFVGFRKGTAIVSVHGGLSSGGLDFTGLRLAALGTAIGEAGLIGLELELFRADGAGFDGEGHAVF